MMSAKSAVSQKIEAFVGEGYVRCPWCGQVLPLDEGAAALFNHVLIVNGGRVRILCPRHIERRRLMRLRIRVRR